ncbi:MAG: hypothetical protein GXP27_19360 [Planctomycetes bacterium]|nr:hypothetical protein [Planctomycetota bacterium]
MNAVVEKSKWLIHLLAVLAMFLASGCMDEPLDYVEVKRLDEPVSEAELQSLLRIVHALPEGRLPRFLEVFQPVPEWNRSRNLPVNELLEEQRQLLERRWSIDAMAESLQGNRILRRVLRRERMTLKQFVSLALAVGVAMARSTLREDQDLDAILQKGEIALKRLRRDTRPYSSLTKAGMYYVAQQARWLTRVYRARYLKMVPDANVQLVRSHWPELAKVFPEPFTTNPLDAISDPLEERGVPFKELAETGSDDNLRWSPSRAIVGSDVPDSQMADRSAAGEGAGPAPQAPHPAGDGRPGA